MKSVKKILCVIDPTEDEQPARDRAAMLAKAFDASLHLYISYYNAYLPGASGRLEAGARKFSDEAIEVLQGNLEGMARDLRSQGLVVRTNAEWKANLYESIIDEAKTARADLIVKDTHYHTAIARALFTNTDWNLIRKCPVPLWLVKPAVSFGAKPGIVACVDPLHEHDKPESLDEEILRTAADIAGALNGTVHAFHSFNPLVAIGNAAKWAVKPKKLPVEELSDRMQKEHAKAFDQLTRRHGLSSSQCHLKSGAVEDMLPGTVTELQASLAVMGAVMRPRFRQIMIGSTAEKVMDHVPCDLLVLKP